MKPKKCISVEDARTLQKNWKNSRGREIERGQGYPDTSDFWFSIDELQEYLDYVRKESAEQDVRNPGIRIFLGAYPKTERKKGYSTIFLAPTKENNSVEEEGGSENDNNYEIDPLNQSTGGWPPSLY